jgi:hypothetical protein
MYYLNLPLEIWKYVLIFIIIVICVIGYYIIRSTTIHATVRVISVWILVLLELNFINMFYTLKTYLTYSQVVGDKGVIGNIGPRGFRGDSFVCNQCGDSGKDKQDVYGTNINDNEQVVRHPKLQIGQCKFPFVHNNEFQYSCTVEPREDGVVNDADTYGWCATSINNDLTYKTFGYCKNSDIERTRLLKNKTRLNKQQTYNETNYGLLDLEIAIGNRSTVKCPSGYKKIAQDLNSLADGKYIYLCKKMGLGDTGISALKTVEEKTTCPKGYKKLPINLNDSAGGREIFLCTQKADKNFIKNIKVVKNSKCPVNYTISSTNLNKDAGGDELHICVSKTHKLSAVIDTVFVWGGDNNLYFFKDEYYWRYDDKNAMMEEGYPKKIMEFWGRIPKALDAAMTYPYDQKTYFFKGALYYEYDSKKQMIKAGYPKYIKSNWKGVPDNLDTIYIDVAKRQTYFVKGKYYYLYDDKLQKVASGYPKILNRKWKGAPSNISAMFYYPYDEKTYMIQSNRVYEITPNNEMTSDSPMTMGEKFAGIA